jgi:hypothetical protein
MRRADGVPGGPGSGRTGSGSTAEAPRAGAAPAGCLDSAAGAGLEPAAPAPAPGQDGPA